MKALAWLIVSCFMSSALLAQRDSSHTSPFPGVRTSFCFRGNPRPLCSGFMLTEFTLGYYLTGSAPSDRSAMLTWELGAMGNVGHRYAVGLSGFGSVSEQYDTYGPRLRLRYWVSPEVSLDFGPGLALGRSKPGFNGHLGITAGDRIGVVLNVQTRPASSYESSTRALFGGFRLGSGLGVVGGLAVPLIGLIYLISCNCID